MTGTMLVHCAGRKLMSREQRTTPRESKSGRPGRWYGAEAQPRSAENPAKSSGSVVLVQPHHLKLKGAKESEPGQPHPGAWGHAADHLKPDGERISRRSSQG